VLLTPCVDKKTNGKSEHYLLDCQIREANAEKLAQLQASWFRLSSVFSD
jgi:hypothetical protein